MSAPCFGAVYSPEKKCLPHTASSRMGKTGNVRPGARHPRQSIGAGTRTGDRLVVGTWVREALEQQLYQRQAETIPVNGNSSWPGECAWCPGDLRERDCAWQGSVPPCSPEECVPSPPSGKCCSKLQPDGATGEQQILASHFQNKGPQHC